MTPHRPTTPPPHRPTAYRPTVPPSHRPTAPPPHHLTASPPHGPTTPRSHRSTALLPCRPTAPPPPYPTAPPPHNPTTPSPLLPTTNHSLSFSQLCTGPHDSNCPSLLQHGRRRYRCADCMCVRGAEGLTPLQDEPQCPICLDLVTVRLGEEGTSATRSTRSNPAAATGSLKAQCCGVTYHLSCLQANQLHSNASEAPCPICRSTTLGRQVRHATRTSLV